MSVLCLSAASVFMIRRSSSAWFDLFAFLYVTFASFLVLVLPFWLRLGVGLVWLAA